MTHQLKPSDLLTTFRREVDDLLPEGGDDSASLWKDDEIYDYMHRAQMALCKYTHYLIDTVTTVVIADQETATLPSRVYKVNNAYLDSTKTDLDIRDSNELGSLPTDDYGAQITGQWRTSEGGPPRVIVLDLLMGKIRFIPIPGSDDTLVLEAELMPHRVSEDYDEFSIRREDHIYALLPMMKSLAYEKHDADAYDPQLSLKYEGQALRRFQEVYDDVKQLRRSGQAGSGTTRYGGIPL